MKYTAQNYAIDNNARILFNRLLKIGNRYRSFLKRIMRYDCCILDLKTLVEIVPPTGEYSDVIKDVHVDLIIGTENRSQDFTECFYPQKVWLQERWIKIYKLMHSEGISEPIKLIEYGGYYFVRDGNHRVSVAIHSGIEYLTAEITHYRIPFKLPDNLNRKKLDLLSEKYQFHKRTGFFDIVDDHIFDVNKPCTWKKLEKEIYINSRSWFVRYHKAEPKNDKEFIDIWINFYKITIEHIHQKSLLLLFPGMHETDVFVEIVEFWNSYKHPDSFWVGEIYEKFEQYFHRKKVFLWIHQVINKLIHNFTSSAEESKNFFLHTTRINVYIPEFTPPVAGKSFYNLCYRQIFLVYAKTLMIIDKKQPNPFDICMLWYGNFYKPVMEQYKKYLYPVTFERFYKKFSRLYFRKVITVKVSIEKCIEEFVKKIR